MADIPALLSFIDPDQPVQVRCFAAWAALGGRPRAVTTPEGAEKLRALGFGPADFLVLPGPAIRDRDGAALLVPLLRELARKGPAGQDAPPVMLVQSALWPALRTMGAITHWAGLAPALALTAEICASIDSHDPDDARPDRSRFAAFVLTGPACAAVADLLDGCDGAGALAFDDPGAGQLLAAALRAPSVGGVVMDSGLLLDETVGRAPGVDPSADSGADPEVGPFLADIARLCGIAAPDATQRHAILGQLIRRECRRQGPQRDTARMLFYRPVPRPDPPDPAALRIAAQLVKICPELTWWHSLAALAALAHRVSAEGRRVPGRNPNRAPDRALTFFVVNPDPQYQFTQILLAILFVQMCHATGAAEADAIWTLPAPSVPQEPTGQGDEAQARVAAALGAAPFLAGRPAGLADDAADDEAGRHIALLAGYCTTTAEHRILDALVKGVMHVQ